MELELDIAKLDVSIHDLGPVVKVGQLDDNEPSGEQLLEYARPIHDLWLDCQMAWVWWTSELAPRIQFDEKKPVHLVEFHKQWADAYRDRLFIQVNCGVEVVLRFIEAARASLRLNEPTDMLRWTLFKKSRISKEVPKSDYVNYFLVFEKVEPVYEDGQPYPMTILYRRLALLNLSRHA